MTDGVKGSNSEMITDCTFCNLNRGKSSRDNSSCDNHTQCTCRCSVL